MVKTFVYVSIPLTVFDPLGVVQLLAKGLE